MPSTLKIVIGLIAIAIISQVFSIAKYKSLDNPGSYAMNLFWIIAWISVIKGFLNRSHISRRLAIGISFIGLLCSAYAFYWFTVMPLPEQEDHTVAIIFSIIGILIQGYVIVVLSSKKVITYFNEKRSSVQQMCVGDGRDHTAP